eukprot:COSAG06_NODE_31_length_31488_cov_60.882793_29_plen_56_part_00
MRFSQEYVIRVESAEASFTCRRRYSHFLALHEKVPDRPEPEPEPEPEPADSSWPQ